MNPALLARMKERANAVQVRARIRAFDYRQRAYSKGVWYRLRRVLVDAAEAYAIEEGAARSLAEQGHVALAVGKELHPERIIFMVERAKLEELKPKYPVALRLDDVLREPYLVLVPWESEER